MCIRDRINSFVIQNLIENKEYFFSSKRLLITPPLYWILRNCFPRTQPFCQTLWLRRLNSFIRLVTNIFNNSYAVWIFIFHFIYILSLIFSHFLCMHYFYQFSLYNINIIYFVMPYPFFSSASFICHIHIFPVLCFFICLYLIYLFSNIVYFEILNFIPF